MKYFLLYSFLTLKDYVGQAKLTYTNIAAQCTSCCLIFCVWSLPTLNKLKQLNGFTESKQYSMKKYRLSVRIQSSFLVLIFPNLDRIWRFTFSPADIYFIEVNNWNNRTKCEICSKLTIKTLERHWAIRSFKRRIPQSRMIEERG